MGIVIKQTVRNALSNYVGLILGAFNLTFLYPRVFEGHQDYFGLIQLILGYAILVSTFGSLGVPSMFIKYFPRLEKMDQAKLISFSLLYPLPLLFLLGLVILNFQTQIIPWLNSEVLFLQYWWVLVPLAISHIYFEILGGISQSYLQTQLPLFLKEVGRRLIATVLLLFFWIGWIDLGTFLNLYIACSFGLLFILWLRLYFKKQLDINISFGTLPLKQMMAFGGFLIVTSGATLLVNKIDVLMVGHYIDLESVGYYSVVVFMGASLNIPNKSLGNIMRPMMSKAFAENNLSKVAELYKASALNLMLVGFLLFSLLLTNLEDIFYLLPESYREGQNIVWLIATGQLINLSAGQNGVVLSFSKYYKFNLIAILVLLVLTVGSNIILIPKMGLMGAAIATAISLSIFNLSKLIYIKIKLSLWPYEKRVFGLLIVFVVTFILGTYFNVFSHPIIEILARSSVVTLVFLVLVYGFKISPEFTNLIQKKLKKYVA